MKARVRSKAIHGVIAATLAWLSYFPDADALEPDGNEPGNDPWVQALVDEAENGELDLELDRLALLRRLAVSNNRGLRARVAEATGELGGPAPDGAQALLRQLAHDPAGRVRLAAARGLARFMEHADARLRASVESGWVRAQSEDERVAFALALGQVTPDFLTDLALHELAADHRPRVRQAALLSASALLPQQPEPYVRLMAARVDDPDRRTRKRARAALRASERRPEVVALRCSPDQQRESRHRLRRALRSAGDRAPGSERFSVPDRSASSQRSAVSQSSADAERTPASKRAQSSSA